MVLWGCALTGVEFFFFLQEMGQYYQITLHKIVASKFKKIPFYPNFLFVEY